MKIREIRLTGLAGATVEGGWAHDHKPEDDIHTLVEVVTDEGLSGWGSVSTSKALTDAGVRLLRPLLIDERLMKTAREAVGPGVELMVDAGGSEQFWPHGYKWALETAKMLADFDVVWFEEALPPDDVEGFAELRRHAPVKIATGEVLTRRQSFRPFLERHAV